MGYSYTWSRKTIYSKLDSVIANGDFFEAYPAKHYLVLPEGISDN